VELVRVISDDQRLHQARRGSAAEVGAWLVCALLISSAAIALFRYMYLGLFSFLLLPVAAISWSRTIILSAPAREGGKRHLIVATLVVGTVIGAVIFSWVARGLLGPGGIRD
jgi:hypothetical protein